MPTKPGWVKPPGWIAPSPIVQGGASASESGKERASTSAPTTDDTAPVSGIYALVFYANPDASDSSQAMSRAGTAATISPIMPYRGSILALSLTADDTKDDGSCVFTVRKNGTATEAKLTWSDATQRQTQPFLKGDYPFVRDDYIDVVFTTSSGYSPATTNVEVTVYVALDQQEA